MQNWSQKCWTAEIRVKQQKSKKTLTYHKIEHLSAANIGGFLFFRFEIRLEREAAAEAHEYFRHIPKGHSCRPAHPYPPERIPEDEPVPDFPEPIARYEDVPVKDKYYMEQPDYNRIPT